MSDCHDRTREDRAELVAEGRGLLSDTHHWAATAVADDTIRAQFWHLLDRALDAIEHLDREPARLAGRPGHRINLDETIPTMKVALVPLGIDVRIE